MIDTHIIPHKDAILALDLASTAITTHLDDGITLTNNDNYLKLKNLYTFNKIKSKFADLVLQSAKAEGIRQTMMNQPIHIRHLASTPNDVNLSETKS
jgi:hypothetical protein